jgi:aminoglycoside phosphotransferase (APT) family kinase protein
MMVGVSEDRPDAGPASQHEERHGFHLDPDDERLLRGPVPPPALRWAAAAIGAGARVRESAPLVGGSSSAVHELSVEDARGHFHELVLRRFVRQDWLAEEPDLAEREATALELLAGGALPAPRLVAVDAEGSATGAPAVLMTRLPGRIEWEPSDVDRFLRALAELLPVVHATPFPSWLALPEYRPYPLRIRRPPAWASRPQVWRAAIELLDAGAPPGERLLIHRDYHPGNVLWQDGRVSGLVDWVNASIGSPWADVGHCRVNLASELGEPAVERFLDHYRAASGRSGGYHPYWDIAAAIGGLDDDIDAAPSPGDEDFLVRALGRL